MAGDDKKNQSPKLQNGDDEKDSVGLTVGDIDAQLEFQKYTDGIARVHRSRRARRAKQAAELIS